MSEERYTGKVIWFNASRGIGFIEPEEGEKDFFVHYSQIRSDAKFKTLVAGQVVSYVIGANKNGPQAEDVVILEEPEFMDE